MSTRPERKACIAVAPSGDCATAVVRSSSSNSELGLSMRIRGGADGVHKVSEGPQGNRRVGAYTAPDGRPCVKIGESEGKYFWNVFLARRKIFCEGCATFVGISRQVVARASVDNDQ